MKRFLKASLIVLSAVAGIAATFIGFSYWLQKQLDEVFGDIDWGDGFEEEKSGIIPEIVEEKTEK